MRRYRAAIAGPSRTHREAVAGTAEHMAEAAGGARMGYWFAPERDGGKDGERITLNPSGFSVSTILPSVSGYALLAVPR